jgi:hypothetical protein
MIILCAEKLIYHSLFNQRDILHSFCLFLLQLAIEVIHNMRTIKQLSVEKEVLRQYSECIDKIFMLVF